MSEHIKTQMKCADCKHWFQQRSFSPVLGGNEFETAMAEIKVNPALLTTEDGPLFNPVARYVADNSLGRSYIRKLIKVGDQFGTCQRFKNQSEFNGKTDEIVCPYDHSEGGPGAYIVAGAVRTGRDFGCVKFESR